MAPSPLVKKLRMHTAQRALLLNSPEGYVDSLGELPEGIEISAEPEASYDFVHLFAANSQELERLLPAAMGAVEYDGLLWISYPKRSSKVATDLSRDSFWELENDVGLRPVTQVSVNEIWSALRFRPAERVGK